MSPAKVLVSETVQPPAWNRCAAMVAVVLLVLFSTISGSRPVLMAELLGLLAVGLVVAFVGVGVELRLVGVELRLVGALLPVETLVLTEGLGEVVSDPVVVPVAFAACRPLG